MKKIFLCALVLLVINSVYAGELSRNNSKQIVNDSATGLMWQDDDAVKSVKIWQEAIDYCESLRFAGYSNWRLPSKDELLSIVDKNNKPMIKAEFKNIRPGTFPWYWSSTPSEKRNDKSWFVQFNTGNAKIYPKNKTSGIRCVRGK
jgi:hypothetical protein